MSNEHAIDWVGYGWRKNETIKQIAEGLPDDEFNVVFSFVFTKTGNGETLAENFRAVRKDWGCGATGA